MQGFVLKTEENSIAAFPSADAATDYAFNLGNPHPRPDDDTTVYIAFSSESQLDGMSKGWPGAKLVAIWNNLPGVTPVKKFTDRSTGVRRIWKVLNGQQPEQPEQAEVEVDTNAQNRQEEELVKKQTQKTKSQRSPKGKAQTTKPAKAAKPAPREARPAEAGTKTEMVIGLLKRRNGATLPEIMEKAGWQQHSVRGFVAGTLKTKMGLEVESFKTENGERAYRIVA